MQGHSDNLLSLESIMQDDDSICFIMLLTCVSNISFNPPDNSKDWLVDRRKAIGRTALCLSGGGSLAMHHMGVCRFLLEASTSMRKGQQNRSSLQWMGNLDLSCWGVQKLSAFRCHQHTVIAFESWQEGLMPKIVSGVSGGSIVAGFLAIHTDEEKLGYAYSHA